VWPILLVTAGVLLLLNNLGMVSWSVWFMLLRLWPVLLIAIGLDLMIGRRTLLGAVAAFVVVGGLVGGAAWFAASGRSLAPVGQRIEEIAYPLGAFESADVLLAPGVGSMRVRALSDSANFVEGTLQLRPGETLVDEFAARGVNANLELRSRGQRRGLGHWGPQDGWAWDVALHDAVMLDLEIEMGVGQLDLELTHLRIRELRVDAGIGQTTLYLPAAGRYNVVVDSGIGEVTLFVPRGLGVRLPLDAGLGNVDVPADFILQGDFYESPDYAEAESRATIEVDHGIGRVQVRYGNP